MRKSDIVKAEREWRDTKNEDAPSRLLSPRELWAVKWARALITAARQEDTKLRRDSEYADGQRMAKLEADNKGLAAVIEERGMLIRGYQATIDAQESELFAMRREIDDRKKVIG